MQEYSWPGNVRELENTVESCLALSTGPELIGVDELPSALATQSGNESSLRDMTQSGLNLERAVTDLERRLINTINNSISRDILCSTS